MTARMLRPRLGRAVRDAFGSCPRADAPITPPMSTGSLEPPAHRRPIGRLLVEMGALSLEDLEQLLALQRNGGGLLGEIAVGRGLASPLILLTALKKQQALPQLQ